ncbi:MAG: permease-like cell division protein FtsX [Eubacteriaceae bacterium]|nr:permease-like cell division protein FtsX [Eubacteriaceae bacterium]
MNRAGYTIGQSFRQIHRNKAMSFASIFAITAMLLILGLFFIVIVNVNTVAESIKGDYNTIEVFMKDDTAAEVIKADKAAVESWDNVKSVQYRTKDDAMDILKNRWGSSSYLLDGLKTNPLPDSIVITVSDLNKADAVAEKAKTITGVEDVKYYKDTVDKLLKATHFIQIAALIVMGFLIIVSVVVVANTIKLTVINRAEEISIMKYVGATNWFIRGPFLFEGIWIGGISALISTGIIALIYNRVTALIGTEITSVLSIPLVPSNFLIFNLLLIFIALGVSIGAWGSIISMRRFLDT